MLPMLREVEEVKSYISKSVKGYELIAKGIYKTEKGDAIVRSKLYKTKDAVKGFVNHEKKIKKIISDAKTAIQIENDLALYLSKNAKSLDHIKQ